MAFRRYYKKAISSYSKSKYGSYRRRYYKGYSGMKRKVYRPGYYRKRYRK